MTDIRRSRLFLALRLPVAVSLLVAACERPKAVPVVESTKVIGGATTQVAPTPALATWDPALGPLMLIGGSTPASAELLAQSGTDSTRLPGTHIVLLGRGGESQPALLEQPTTPEDEACKGLGAWLVGAANGTLGNWSIGFSAKDQVVPLPMDSVEALSPADSASLAAQVTRLASTIATPESKRFSGLPFSVLSLWRFSPARGSSAIAANLIRKLNVEANPMEERTTIIAEKDSASSSYSLAFMERSQGAEETVESRDFVAALFLGASRTPVLVMTHDYDGEIAYSILERAAPGQWRVRWTSARVRC